MTLEQCQGVGVGLPGPVDAEGNILECVNLGWGIFPVEKEISGRLNGIFVKAGNDANVAALGEQSAGAGAGKKNFVMVTLGTGVGGGIIVNGKILEGTNGAAGEIGHIPVNTEEEETCSCGKRGCLEQYASATGIVRVAQTLREKYPDTTLQEGATAKDICDGAKAGDALCMETIQILGKYLGVALASTACVLNPECICIGGGVSRAGQILIDAVTGYFQQYVFKPCRKVDFQLAKLGNDAGIYGAAALVPTA
jgi:glucokinase